MSLILKVAECNASKNKIRYQKKFQKQKTSRSNNYLLSTLPFSFNKQKIVLQIARKNKKLKK